MFGHDNNCLRTWRPTSSILISQHEISLESILSAHQLTKGSDNMTKETHQHLIAPENPNPPPNEPTKENLGNNMYAVAACCLGAM